MWKIRAKGTYAITSGMTDREFATSQEAVSYLSAVPLEDGGSCPNWHAWAEAYEVYKVESATPVTYESPALGKGAYTFLLRGKHPSWDDRWCQELCRYHTKVDAQLRASAGDGWEVFKCEHGHWHLRKPAGAPVVKPRWKLRSRAGVDLPRGWGEMEFGSMEAAAAQIAELYREWPFTARALELEAFEPTGTPLQEPKPPKAPPHPKEPEVTTPTMRLIIETDVWYLAVQDGRYDEKIYNTKEDAEVALTMVLPESLRASVTIRHRLDRTEVTSWPVGADFDARAALGKFATAPKKRRKRTPKEPVTASPISAPSVPAGISEVVGKSYPTATERWRSVLKQEEVPINYNYMVGI